MWEKIPWNRSSGPGAPKIPARPASSIPTGMGMVAFMVAARSAAAVAEALAKAVASCTWSRVDSKAAAVAW